MQIPPPEQLVIEDWQNWKSSWNNYELATGVADKDDKIRVATLLAVIGKEGNRIYRTLKWDNGGDEKRMDAVLAKLEGFCLPKKNEIYQRYMFNKRNQEAHETIDQYLLELRILAESCDFGNITTEQIVRDRIVIGVKDEKIRERLLREQDLKLNKAIDIVRAAEQSRAQMNELCRKEKFEEIQLECAAAQLRSSGEDMVDCKFCGRTHKRRQCPAYGKECSYCGKRNHFAARCFKKNKRANQIGFCEDNTLADVADEYHILVTGNGKNRAMINLTANGKNITFQIDSGAECNLIPANVYKQVTGDLELSKLKKNAATIVMYNQAKEKVLGQCKLQVERKKVKHDLVFNVVRGNYRPILGLEAAENMGILKILDCDYDISAVSDSFCVNEINIIHAYADVFCGLGSLEGQYHIKLKEHATPVVHAPRRVPIAIRDEVKLKLDNLVNEGVICSVTEPTEWVSSMVVAKKANGKLRICLDPKDLNEVILREHYPLPTIEDVSAKMAQAKTFSVLDASNGFWQVQLDDNSSYLTTFNTPFGRYRWRRMPFGIKSAPEVWQRKMNEIIEGLDGVAVIADDFLVYGCGETQELSNQDHDANLLKFLDRARKVNLKLNRDKLKLKLDRVAFIGHQLTSNGLEVDPEKVRAINEMPIPEDAAGILRFTGMVTYLAKFVPNMSDMLEPLRRLTVKDVDFQWTIEQQTAFENIKKILIEAPVLKYYDPKLPIKIQCDSSDKGLGAVLIQEGRLVHAASRALTPTETRYAQIEKEMLAIVFACNKFDTYIYGKEAVQVESDHQPLETI